MELRYRVVKALQENILHGCIVALSRLSDAPVGFAALVSQQTEIARLAVTVRTSLLYPPIHFSVILQLM